MKNKHKKCKAKDLFITCVQVTTEPPRTIYVYLQCKICTKTCAYSAKNDMYFIGGAKQ